MAEHEAPVSFAEKVFALSKIIHVHKFRNNVSAEYNPHQKKHLRLLDDIALLLVTEPNSDVAAVSFEQQPKSVTFYYTKNRSSTPSEKAHIEQVLEIAKGPLDVNRIDLILNKVLTASRGKILSRLAKLKAIIGKTSVEQRYLRRDENGQLHWYLQRELGNWYVDYASPSQFLDELLAHIENLAVGKCSTAEILQIVSVAHSTCSYKPAHTVFPDKELERRVRLLGDYFGAVKRIVKSVDSIRRAASSPAPMNIKFQEVPVLAPRQCSMPASFMPILNRYATEHHMSPITPETLLIAYPNSTRVPITGSTMQPVRQTVHAECSLAVFMSSLDRNWEFVEIGCSKGSCWLCEMYLRQESRLKFHVSNVHGKLQAGWTLPPGGDETGHEFMLQLVDDEVHEILLKSENSRRGDSHPRSGSESGDQGKKVNEREGKLFWSKQ